MSLSRKVYKAVTHGGPNGFAATRMRGDAAVSKGNITVSMTDGYYFAYWGEQVRLFVDGVQVFHGYHRPLRKFFEKAWAVLVRLPNFHERYGEPVWDDAECGFGHTAYVEVPYTKASPHQVFCPFSPGDECWVRETWAEVPWWPGGTMVLYKADDPPPCDWDPKRGDVWKSPAIMPRSASRLTLRTTDVRACRVGEIGHDFITEMGCPIDTSTPGELDGEWQPHRKMKAAAWFVDWWDKQHAKPRPIRRNGQIVAYQSFPYDGDYRETTHNNKPHYVHGNPWVFVGKGVKK